jgi:N-acetylglutamate synthase-like GNAT family acetyltransferase
MTAVAKVHIRAATTADLPVARALVASAALPPDGLEDFLGEGYVVVEFDGELVGIEGVEVHGRDGLLRSAAVAPGWRGRGLGARMTRDRIAWSRRRGLRALYLLTTTAGDYFPRFGFVPADRTAAPDAIRNSLEFSQACPETALLMCLALGSESGA